MSGDPEQEYFADGMVEEMALAAVARIDNGRFNRKHAEQAANNKSGRHQGSVRRILVGGLP